MGSHLDKIIVNGIIQALDNAGHVYQAVGIRCGRIHPNLDFIAREVSPNTYVNVMPQYRPTFRAHEFPDINRRPDTNEYASVVRHARKLELRLSR